MANSGHPYRPIGRDHLKLDTVLDGPLDHIAGQAAALHTAGFDGVYTQEANRDVWFPLLLAAQAAPLDIYPNVAIAFPRSPMHLAYAAFDLQRASGGKFALGLGSQIKPHVEKRFSAQFGKPVEHMAELIGALRAIFGCFHSGDRLDFRGKYYTHTLMTPTFIPAPLESEPPPIWIGALGSRMTRMSAELADGVLIHPFNTAHFLRTVTLPNVEAGLMASGRRRSDFMLGVDVIPCVYRNESERTRAIAGCRSNLAFYASTPSYRVTLDAHGWGELQPELNLLTKQGRWGDMPGLISDELLEAICPMGSPEQVARQLRVRYRGVADRVALSIPYRVEPDALAELADAFARDRT
jgi:probable F420-dependent oxidoreductase